ncbi:calmin [Myripristis murdjan]|uniref:calmin n=1 Tax=Myripristis murdjan TaxID=586833 RepID=UPI0011763954|nr:calmin-like [Myripristis murdjan]
MAMQDKTRLDGQEKSVGEINDPRALCPEGSLEESPLAKRSPNKSYREAVQKRTFTRWMTVFLQRCEPPVEVHDLFTDIQDGRVLMALLEELSGCKLVYRFRPSSHRIFRLNNIAKALAFLDDRHVKLLGIDASGIADGIPSVVLNLVWNIILYFQIKEATGGLQRHYSSSLSSLSMSSYDSSGDLSPLSINTSPYSSSTLPTKGRKAARTDKYHGKVIKMLLLWVQRCTSKFGVEVRDFGKSWRSGLAFLALIKSIDPALVDLRGSLTREPREIIQEAFMIAQHSFGIPPLLEPEDVTCTSPDERSIITYVSMFLQHYSAVNEDDTTDIEMTANIPGIPSFSSLESISFGETDSHAPEAQAILKDLEKNSEQLLWTRWSRRSSGGPRATLVHQPVTSDLSMSSHNLQSSIDQTVDRTTTSQYKKRGSLGVFQPISPLDIGNVDQDIRLWMEKASADQRSSKQRTDEGNFSLSSEEGIYSLSTLDSDEEDAYNYILDLNKDVFQSYNQLNRQAPKFRGGITEEVISKPQLTGELKRQNESKVLLDSGSEYCFRNQEKLHTQNGDFKREAEDTAKLMDQGSTDMEESANSFQNERRRIREAKRSTETENNRKMFDMEEQSEGEGRSKEASEEEGERVVREQNNDANYEEKEKVKEEKRESGTFVRQGDGERETPLEKSENEEYFEVARWEKENFGQAGEMRVAEKEAEEQHLLKFKKVEEDGKAGKGEEGDETLEDNVKEEKGAEEQIVMSLESFNMENQETFTNESVNEVRGTTAVRVNTGEATAAGTEDITKVEEEDVRRDYGDVEQKEHYNEVMNAKDFKDITTVEKDRELENKKHRTVTEEKGTAAGHPVIQNFTKTGVHPQNDGKNNPDWTSACSATPQSFSEGGVILQTLAASCEVTPLELELLLVLWILLYCYFILPQMNP